MAGAPAPIFRPFVVDEDVCLFAIDLGRAGHDLETRIRLFKDKYPEAWFNNDIGSARKLDYLLINPESNAQTSSYAMPDGTRKTYRVFVNTGVAGSHFRRSFGNPGGKGTNHYIASEDCWIRIKNSGIFTFDYEPMYWDAEKGCWMHPSYPWREGTTIEARPAEGECPPPPEVIFPPPPRALHPAGEPAGVSP